MAVILSQIETPISAKREDIISIAIKKSGLKKSDILSAEIHKTSLDARKQNNMKLVNSVYLELNSRNAEKRLCDKLKNCKLITRKEISPVFGNKKMKHPPVIVGFGPAGMFAALILAENGYRPIVLERGDSVDERIERVQNFWNNGILDTNSNVQFGEGGAGTFSDGKLTTRINDPLCDIVLRKFTEFGAPQEILTKAKPHIGTDNLRSVVKAIRHKIEELGGKVRFRSQLTDIQIKNNAVCGISVNGIETAAESLVLAIGHSARDTFEMLLNKNVFLEAKPFSVGARIEHTQESVNRSLYGKYYDNPLLPQGEYQISHRTEDGRGVYTFCMCPGGLVVPSSSEENTVVTNGMSEFARDRENANSALVVSVSPDDFGKNPLDGVNFARSIEQKAFAMGGKNYSAPAVSVGNFLDEKAGISSDSVASSYALGVIPGDFDKLFPAFVTKMMREGLQRFPAKLAFFGDKKALLTGPETRTSSPVRITRKENLQSQTVKNLYPCGEGAGYAGGIMSAAVDGIRIALKIMENYSM